MPKGQIKNTLGLGQQTFRRFRGILAKSTWGTKHIVRTPKRRPQELVRKFAHILGQVFHNHYAGEFYQPWYFDWKSAVVEYLLGISPEVAASELDILTGNMLLDGMIKYSVDRSCEEASQHEFNYEHLLI